MLYLVLTALGYLFVPISVNLHLAVILLLAIPVSGVTAGIIFLRKKINAVKTGEWEEELSGGFPSAIKILSELDWDKTLDEISRGRVSYAIYGGLKTILFWFIAFFAIEHIIGL